MSVPAQDSISERVTARERANCKTPITVFVFICVLLVFLFLSLPSDKKDEEVTLCHTKVCERMSEMMRANMNTSVNPCNNFYQYACGNFKSGSDEADENDAPSSDGDEEEYEVDDDEDDDEHDDEEDDDEDDDYDGLSDNDKELLMAELSKPVFTGELRPVTYIKQLYQKCINQEDSEETKSKLETLVREIEINQSTPLSMAIARALNRGTPSFVSASITNYPDYPKERILRLGRPLFSVPMKYLIANESNENATRIRNAYQQFISEGLRLYYSQIESNRIAQLVLYIDSQLVNIFDGEDDSKETVTVEELIEIFGADFNITDIVKVYLGDWLGAKISIQDFNYMTNLSSTLNLTSEMINHYHRWKVIEKYGPLLSRNLRKAQFEFLRTKNPLKYEEEPDEKDFCLHLVFENMREVFDRLYVDAINFSSLAKRGVEKMTKDIQNSIVKMINEDGWLDEDTKERALKKVRQMTINIAYPKWIRNDTSLTEFLPLRSRSNDSVFDLLLRVQSFTLKENIRKLRANAEFNFEKEWDDSPAVYNGFYTSRINALTVLAAVLRSPLDTDDGMNYDFRLPAYYNYGNTGSTIGHEIFHGFDSGGVKYDAYGRKRNWLGAESLRNFNSSVELLIKQYSSIKDKTTGLHLNGTKTQSEDIADLSGLIAAYTALFESSRPSRKQQLLPHFESFTPERMFFLSNAYQYCSNHDRKYRRTLIRKDTHTLNEYRVNVPLRNFEKFAEAFSCPKNSPMNPVHKIRIW